MSPSKKSLRATEQERADVARARRRWIRKQGLLDPARLVFIDETATSTSLVRLRGRCPRGGRLVGSVPHGHWKTITLVVGLRHDGTVAGCRFKHKTCTHGNARWTSLHCGRIYL